MKFALLLQLLDESKNDISKTTVLLRYSKSQSQDHVLDLFRFFQSIRSKKICTTQDLLIWTKEICNLPDWLFEKSLSHCNDVLDAINLLLPINVESVKLTLPYVQNLYTLKFNDENQIKEFVTKQWSLLDHDIDRYFFNRIITGNFRLKISDLILFDFLAAYFETTRINISIFHALNLLHSKSDIKKQLKTGKSKALIKKFEPVKEVEYIEVNIEELSLHEYYVVTPIWIGVEIQIIKFNHDIIIWDLTKQIKIYIEEFLYQKFKSRDEDFIVNAIYISSKSQNSKSNTYIIITDFISIGQNIEFSKSLQKQTNFIEQWILSLDEREGIYSNECLNFQNHIELSTYYNQIDLNKYVSILVELPDESIRILRPELFQLKAVLLYAQKKDQTFSHYYDQYTFGVLQLSTIVPIVKLDADLEETEVIEIHQFILENTIERFGPVRSISPQLIFNLQYSRIERSKRHKSGIILKNAKIISTSFHSALDELSRLSHIVQKAIMEEEN